jgi:hypothetical protein
MRDLHWRRFAVCLATLLLVAGSLLLAADEPANVAGTWKVAVSGDAGNAKQTIVLKQDSNKITGTFKGPRQSGPLEGTVDGNNISFHVATRVPLDYKGIVDGHTMKGTLTGKGKTGNWTATRAK